MARSFRHLGTRFFEDSLKLTRERYDLGNSLCILFMVDSEDGSEFSLLKTGYYQVEPEKRMREGFDCKDWFFCKKKLG